MCRRAPGPAVPGHQLQDLALGDMAGRQLRAQISEHAYRNADIALNDLHNCFVALVLRVELERWDAQTFGVDLGRIRSVGARDATADIGVMADRGREREPLATTEHRLEHEDVGQMHTAFERVVQHEHVTRPDVARKARQHRCQRGRYGPEVTGQGQTLRHQPAVPIRHRRREIHVVPEHARISRAHNGQRHLVGDRQDRVLEQLELDRIGHPTPPPHAISRRAKTRGRAPSRHRFRAAGRHAGKRRPPRDSAGADGSPKADQSGSGSRRSGRNAAAFGGGRGRGPKDKSARL